MAIKDSWRKAMVLSGLVDDNPKTDPDFLAKLAPGPSEAPPEPPLTVPAAWAPPAAPPEAAPITVRRRDTPAPPPVEQAAAPPPPAPSHRPPPAQAAIAPPYVPPPAPPPPPPRAAPHFTPTGTAGGDVSVHRVAPKSFNDAQLVADRFKAGTPVVLDMQAVESDLAKRLIGFASGLTYGLDGGMERLDGRVFLLIPPGVEVPAGQRARLAAQGSLARA